MPGYLAGVACIAALAAISISILLQAAAEWPRIVAALFPGARR